jgi:hypothetical protein
MLVAVMDVVLVLGTLKAMRGRDDLGLADLASGDLSFCTLCVSLLCGVVGHSSLQVLLRSASFYAWGLSCLLLVNTFHVNDLFRFMLAIVGVCYVIWAWIPPGPHRNDDS